MKKKLIATVFSLSFVSPASYAGIPVIDAGAIAQTALVVAEATKQLEQLKAQIDQFEQEANETKRRLEGYKDYGSVFDSSGAYLDNSLGDLDVSDSDIDEYLRSVGIQAEPDSQRLEQYRQDAKRVKQLEQSRARLVSQANRMDALQAQFSAATTPKERELIANTIQLESLKSQNTLKAVELELAMQDKESQLKEKEAYKAYMNKGMQTPEMSGYFDLSE